MEGTELASNITECPIIEEIWKLDEIESEIQISHSDIGPYIHVFCPRNHHVVGPAMVTCLKGGVWDDVTLPTCSDSSMFDVPASTMILISILGGCGALIIITFNFILAHLLYFKKCPIFPARSGKEHNDSMESDESLTYHRAPKRYYGDHTISSPQYPTLNGQPMTSPNYNHVMHETGGDIATVSNGNMFVNHVFHPDESLGNSDSGGNTVPPPPPPIRIDSTSSMQSTHSLPQPLQPHENRTPF